MRVVDLGGSAARTAAEGPRVCTRCRGTVDASAQFCRFCGAALEIRPQHPPPQALSPLPLSVRPGVPAVGVRPGPPPGSEPITSPPVQPAEARSGTTAAPGPAAAPAISPSPRPALASQLETLSPRGHLVVIAKSGADGARYPFGDMVDIGRLEGQIVLPEDPYLSPRHARILWNGSRLVLRDLASTNGVYLRLAPSRDVRKSGRPPSPGITEVSVPLQDQDLILVGQQVLRFELVNEVGFGPATEHGTLLFGSPATPRYARLSQRTVEGVTRDVFHIRKVETVLGRESGDVVFPEDPFLSRRHAAVRVQGRSSAPAGSGESMSFVLVDLGSSNGSFLRIRDEVELLAGDHFRVGQQLFRVDLNATNSPPHGHGE